MGILLKKTGCVTLRHEVILSLFLEWFHYSASCCQKEHLGMNEQKEPSDTLKGRLATADVRVG